MNEIGKRLKSLLDKTGLSPYKVSKRTGVSQATLSRIINKGTTPNESNLKALIDFFGVSETWFLTGSDQKTPQSLPEPLSIGASIDQKFALQEKKIAQLEEQIMITDGQLAELVRHLTLYMDSIQEIQRAETLKELVIENSRKKEQEGECETV